MGTLKYYLKKCKPIVYFYRCMSMYRNKNARELVLEKGNCYRLLMMENESIYGDRIVYYINTGSYVSGFFAEHRRLIDALAYSDLFGMSPYVLYNNDYPYAEDHEINGTTNPFEYYFEQLSDIKYTDFYKYKIVRFKEADRRYIESGLRNTDIASSSYTMSDKDFQVYVDRASKLVRKYIRFNPTTKVYLSESINNLLQGKRTLGVHARGGEWRKPVKNHPVAIPLDEHIEHVKKILEEYDFEQIFLATDEKEAVEAFTEQFGDRVVYYMDTFRGQGGQWLAVTNNDRSNHKYKMGLEVLRDAETLAMCDGLIAGLSNISLYAQIENKALGREYKYLSIQNKGINSEGKTGKELYHISKRTQSQ